MLSIIVLTYNDPQRLRLCLYSLLRQTELDYEVVVVNDGGDRVINKPVYEEIRRTGREVREIWLGPESSEFRAAAARNAGLREIYGARVLFLDGDCILAPNVIAEHARYEDKAILINGTRKHLPENCIEWLQPEDFARLEQLVIKQDPRYDTPGPVYGELGECLRKGATTVPFTHNEQVWSFQLSVPTVTVRQIGGFNEQFIGYGGEDQELAGRLLSVGVSLLGRFDLISYHLDHPPRHDGNWEPWIRRVRESLCQTTPMRNNGPLPGPPIQVHKPVGRIYDPIPCSG